MDFIKGIEQVKIDPSGIDISGAGHITIDSEKISGNLAIDGELNMVGDLSMNGDIEINNGTIGIGKTPQTGILLDVSGNINFNGDLYKNGSLLSLDGNQATAVISRGMVVQIKHTDYREKVVKTTSTHWSAIDARTDGNGFVVKITPKSVNSKILVSTVVHIGQDSADDARWWGARLHRKIGNGSFEMVQGALGEADSSTRDSDGNYSGYGGGSNQGMWVWFSNNQGMLNSDGVSSYLLGNSTASYLDSPDTTEEVIYTIYWSSQIRTNMPSTQDKTIYLNRAHQFGDANRAVTTSSLTATEIWDDSIPFNPTSLAIQIDENTNNVGIGTSSPDSMLNITSTENRGATNTDNKTLLTLHNNPSEDCNTYEWNPISLDFKLSNGDGQYNPITRIASVCCPHTGSAANTAAGERSTALTFSTTNEGTFSEAMRISQKGYIGIGTHSPDAPLHVDTYALNLAHGTNVNSYIRGHLPASLGGPSDVWNTSYAQKFSIHTSYSIWAEEGYVMASDSRIKTDISNINDDRALQQVNALESKEYNYIDPERKNPMKTIGFIAQDVKEVVPNAVSLQKKIIPDEMRMITDPQWSEDAGKYHLNIPDLDMTGAFIGKAKFYVSNDPSGNDEICKEVEIKEILTEDSTPLFPKTKFIAEFDQSWNNVFFYGKEVNDFHTLDKNQIFALHHSAIQELSRKNDEKTEKITTLENKVNNMTVTNALLKSTNENLKSRLETLETIVAGLQNN